MVIQNGNAKIYDSLGKPIEHRTITGKGGTQYKPSYMCKMCKFLLHAIVLCSNEPFSCQNVKTKYNVVPYGDHGTERVISCTYANVIS